MIINVDKVIRVRSVDKHATPFYRYYAKNTLGVEELIRTSYHLYEVAWLYERTRVNFAAKSGIAQYFSFGEKPGKRGKGERPKCFVVDEIDAITNKSVLWANFDYFMIPLTEQEAHFGYHQGQCDDNIAELLEKPSIKAYLDKIPPTRIRLVLREYGAWDENELADEQQNRARILWLACGNIVDDEGV